MFSFILHIHILFCLLCDLSISLTPFLLELFLVFLDLQLFLIFPLDFRCMSDPVSTLYFVMASSTPSISIISLHFICFTVRALKCSCPLLSLIMCLVYCTIFLLPHACLVDDSIDCLYAAEGNDREHADP